MEQIGAVNNRVLEKLEQRGREAQNILTSVQTYLRQGDFEGARNVTLQLDREHRDPVIKLLKEHPPNPEKCEKCGNELKWLLKNHILRWTKSNCSQCEYDGVKANIRDNCQKIMASRGIAKRYLNASLDNFSKSYKQWIKSDSGLFLYGPRGVGKTHLIAAMMREEILTTKPRKFWHTEYNGEQRESYAEPSYSDYPLFISVPELLLKLRGTFNNSTATTEDEILSEYSNAKVLYLDDLGTEKPTEWTLQTLYLLIDRRYSDMLKTNISSNLGLDELADRLDDRISSRIAGMCQVVQMKGKDRRLGAK
jgi:DNA replication protein DnaC